MGINVLIGDLDKQMTEAEAEEKNAQADYEVLMTDSTDKRSADSKSLSEKSGTKADTSAALEGHEEAKASIAKQLGATTSTLHLYMWSKYIDVRRQARADEVESLQTAKAVLSGA